MLNTNLSHGDYLYLDLLKRCVSGLIYEDPSVLGDGKFDLLHRVHGIDRPLYAHSMIGIKRLDNIQWAVEHCMKANIPGDFIETGVWRGGAVILMRALLKVYGVTDRSVIVADSFDGLPPPDPQYPADIGVHFHLSDTLKVSMEEVIDNFRKYDLLDDQVRFLPGWFKDTLFSDTIGQLAILRLDGDMYSSTMETCCALYHKVSAGGVVIVDDYHIDCCKKAITDFRNTNNVNDEIMPIDYSSVYWIKQSDQLSQDYMTSKDALCSLGVKKIYQSVPDYVEAIRLFDMAANRGSIEAMLNIGVLYSHGGPKVPQDLVKALMWLNIVTLQAKGARITTVHQDNVDVAELVDRFRAAMSPEQIAQANVLARDWKPYAMTKWW
ncbi:MAG: class I SAM-dependent methyltransferase [Magnetococcales bacterium]|nr:class I SAM-dependent methyltransferase [Magnetococcales bacterium]